MNLLDWTALIIKLLMAFGGACVGYKASRHYLRREYEQAIYHLLIVIFIAVCIR